MAFSAVHVLVCISTLNFFLGTSGSGLGHVAENSIAYLSFERLTAQESVVVELEVVSIRVSLGLCPAAQPS